MKTLILIAVSTVMLVISGKAGVCMAQEVVVENDSGVGARAMGMGAAQIAAVNGVAGVLYNPAALARIKELEIEFGLDLMKRKIGSILSSSMGKGVTSATTDFSCLGTLGIAYPVPTDRGSLVLALGYNRVKDFSGRLKIDGYNDYLRGIQTGESIEEGGIGIVSLAGAVDISPNISIGASFDIWLGNYTRDNHSLINDETEQYSQLDINGLDNDISAWSIKPSILYFKDNFRFGAYVRIPMTFHIQESFHTEGYSRNDGKYFSLYERIDPSSQFTDEDFTYIDNMSYKLKAPMQIGMGVSWGSPGSNCIAFDIIYENWTQAKLLYPADYMPEPNYFRDKYRSALNWRVGVEKTLPFIDAVGRAGYMRYPLIFRGPRGDDFSDPMIAVTNERDFVTLGLGMQFDRSLGIDIGYAHGLWSQEETPREDKDNLNRVYISINYRMLAHQ